VKKENGLYLADADSRTHISLLDALEKGDTERAWSFFFEKYSKLIHLWCRRWGASVEDTEDIVQETLLVVFRKIAEFQYDPSLSFRAWLKTVSYHKWLQAVEQNRMVYPPVQEPSMVMTYKSRLNLAVEEFKQLLDRIAEQEIFSLACTKVRSRVSERVWLCFEQSELLNQPRSEIAERLGISTGYVQVNVFRVRQLVHAEIKALDHG
jgi:RNA polymerase sigma-70 factor (ECF subfamily)